MAQVLRLTGDPFVDQLLLFQPAEPTTRFRPGEIVRQTWPWIGCYDSIFPYWQVRFAQTGREMRAQDLRNRHSKWSEQKIHRVAGEEARAYGPPDEVKFYCTAVPFGPFPEEIHWFRETDITPTGLSWRIPSWEDIEEWCRRTGQCSTLLAQLNGPHRHHAKPGESYTPSFYPPYEEEEELVQLLRTLPVPWSDVTHDKFYSLFPDGSEDEPTAMIETMSLFA